MRAWSFTILKVVWSLYWLLTAVYCLLAFLPYTYYALIKAPAYDWMPWFVHHHAALYWIALLAAGIAYWPGRKTHWYFGVFTVAVVLGIYLTARPFMPALESNSSAYAWGIIALLQIALLAVMGLRSDVVQLREDQSSSSLLAYSGAVLVAVTVALLYAAGAHVRGYMTTHTWNFHVSDVELITWSVLSHIFVAILIITVLNLIQIFSWKTARPYLVRLALLGMVVFAALWMALFRFLANALSFEGWMAHLYAACFAAAITILGLSVVLPFRTPGATDLNANSRKIILAAIAIVLAITAVALPSIIANGDWNGVLQSTFTLIFWLTLSICFYCVRPRRGSYSVATILAVVILTAFAYKGLQASAIFWAEPLGATDDDISRSMENYAAQDVSFELAHHLLGNARVQPCGDLCRILREYTNIRDARAKNDLKLVESLVPARGERPNIFIFVIDSLRPDYLGAYNPHVDFTPNLDRFAHESVVLRNVYTQYAGTTISEPAIWVGAMLLHTHYLQPFAKVNSLEKMAKVDGYQTLVSYDTVLSQLLSPSDDLFKLDTDKKLWNRFEVCSTVEQTENALDSRPDKSRPVLFYAQPMNVHQFANNDVPGIKASNWRIRPDFNNRIAYEVHWVDDCMGRLVAYLKARGLYDHSIVILTSDHGDATGKFGRFSHSLQLYPEVLHVPLIVHLPKNMRDRFVYDDSRVSALTDITPSLYYLLGHRPVEHNPLFGRPLFTETKEELESYRRDDLFVASDVRAVYGILADNGRYLYMTYDSPPNSFLFDLAHDPNAEHSILTDTLKKHYDEQIIEQLQAIGDFYGYKPGVGSMLASASH